MNPLRNFPKNSSKSSPGFEEGEITTSPWRLLANQAARRGDRLFRKSARHPAPRCRGPISPSAMRCMGKGNVQGCRDPIFQKSARNPPRISQRPLPTLPWPSRRQGKGRRCHSASSKGGRNRTGPGKGAQQSRLLIYCNRTDKRCHRANSKKGSKSNPASWRPTTISAFRWCKKENLRKPLRNSKKHWISSPVMRTRKTAWQICWRPARRHRFETGRKRSDWPCRRPSPPAGTIRRSSGLWRGLCRDRAISQSGGNRPAGNRPRNLARQLKAGQRSSGANCALPQECPAAKRRKWKLKVDSTFHFYFHLFIIPTDLAGDAGHSIFLIALHTEPFKRAQRIEQRGDVRLGFREFIRLLFIPEEQPGILRGYLQPLS